MLSMRLTSVHSEDAESSRTWSRATNGCDTDRRGTQLTRQSVRRLGRCVVSGTGDNTISSSWVHANLGSTGRQALASARRVNAVGILIASMCGVALISLLVLLSRTDNLSGNFWLATLWLTWLVSLIWALTRPSFSVIFTALTLSMFIFIVVPATGSQLYGKTLLAAHDY